MSSLTLRSGPWSAAAVEAYLAEAAIPLRIATNGQGFPLVQSLWFRYRDQALWCCTRADSVIIERLRRDDRCGFEVSADAPPYRGVRGQGRASILTTGAEQLLPELLERYLGSLDSALGHWLMSRIDDELVIRIDGLRVTSWDYSARMANA